MRETYATDTGWTGIRDVRNKASPQNRDDITQTFFFAETLKYLYLTFGSSDEIDLSEWVFNTEAHPVKVSREFAFSF
jgi:mannosyl-oligosaccharide alpha-1,2-mannosidase